MAWSSRASGSSCATRRRAHGEDDRRPCALGQSGGRQLERELQAAAGLFGLHLQIFDADSERDFEPVFARLAALRPGGLVIATDGLFISLSERLAAFTQRHGLPAIFVFRAFAAAGGLMSYGGDITDASRQIGVYRDAS